MMQSANVNSSPNGPSPEVLYAKKAPNTAATVIDSNNGCHAGVVLCRCSTGESDGICGKAQNTAIANREKSLTLNTNAATMA
jgi:hypothetical protein